MGFGLVARGVSTMFVFPIASKYMSSQAVVFMLTIISLIVTVLYIPVTSFGMLFVVTILFNAVYPTLLPAIESTASSLVQQSGVNYGKSRSYGSLGFIISVLIISMLTGYFGEGAILWSMMVGDCRYE